MTRYRKGWTLFGTLLLACAMVSTAAAQITTGTVSGTVKDAQGGVIPGATVVLISEARGTKSVPVVTSGTGDYVIPNVTADTYTLEVTMSGFRTLRREGVVVSGGERVSIPALTIEAGGTSEVVNVTAEAPLIQAQSGERSFSVTSEQVANLPINHGNFTSLTAMVPGVQSGGSSAGGTRLGGAGQNNIQMDGISAMDTGNNGQMLNMNIESIAEVKVLTQGYQAEYGRSSGMQITAVTKGGSNRFHGSLYRVDTNSKWNSNSWANDKNGIAKTRSKNTTQGYSVGGPAGKPGGNNKLFFFYSHEYRPSSSSGSINRFRVPTELERAGDFSQSLDNNGKLIGQLNNPNGGVFAGNIIPAELAVRHGHRAPEPVSGTEPSAARRRKLQPGNPPAAGQAPVAAAGHPRGLPVLARPARHRQVLRPAGHPARRAGHDAGLQRRARAVSVHLQLRHHGQLHVELDDVRGSHLRLDQERAGRRRLGRHPDQRQREPAQQHAGLPAHLPGCRRGRPALLPDGRPDPPEPALVRRHPGEPAPQLLVGRSDQRRSPRTSSIRAG